jgi:hypothetical protein
MLSQDTCSVPYSARENCMDCEPASPGSWVCQGDIAIGRLHRRTSRSVRAGLASSMVATLTGNG